MTELNTTGIFVYTGVGKGASCSKRDVVRVRIDPSVVPEIIFGLTRAMWNRLNFMMVYVKLKSLHSAATMP
jgi:hypothetical protein